MSKWLVHGDLPDVRLDQGQELESHHIYNESTEI